MVAWCEQERLLASLYGFHHLAASDRQAGTDVRGFSDLLERFVQECVEPFISMAGGRDASSDGDTDESDGLQQEGPSGNGYCPGQWCSQSDMRAVRHAVRTMDSCSSPSAVTWFPEYGCALVALGPHGAAALCDGGTSDGGAGSVPDSMAVPEGVPPPGTAPAAAPGAAAAGADTLSLQLVGLDEWCFRVHSCHAYGQMVTAGSSPARPFQHTAYCCGHTVLPCGDVDTCHMSRLLHLVRRLEADRRTAHRKHKYGGRTEPGNKGQKGFQRTPAFMHSVVMDALEGLWSGVEHAVGQGEEGGAGGGGVAAVPGTLPRGGFCDVGRHTGGDAGRDTAWPLVREVLQMLLRHNSAVHPRPRNPDQHPPQLLFRLTMAHLHAWLLHRQMQLLQPAALAPHVVDAVMLMLRATCDHAASLAADGVHVSALEATCCACRQRLEELAGHRALAAAAAHRLPGAIDPWVGLQAPTGVVPAVVSPSGQGEGLTAARRRAARNLGAVPLLREGCGFVRLREVMQGQRELANPRDDVAAMVVLRSVEAEVYGRVTRWASEPPQQPLSPIQAAGMGGGYGVGRGSGSSGRSGSGGVLSNAEVEALEQVVDGYRIAVQAFLDTPAADAVLRAELLSREVLVVWAAYCLIHEAAGREHPMVLRYGVLDERPWEGLRYLVLCDRAAVDAALGVSAYLQQRSVPGRQLFSLCDGGASTNAFALEVARGSWRLCGMWEAEKEDAAARRAAHWREVRRKQVLAAKLRAELAGLRSTEKRFAEESNRLYDLYYSAESGTSVESKYYSRYQAVQEQLRANQREQSRVAAELSRAEKAPPPVLQPLPRDSDKALTWLFYLHMPPLLRHLSRASFLAQQCLLPLPCTHEVAQSLLVQPLQSHLTSYYNRQRTNTTYLSQPRQAQSGQDGAVQIWSYGNIPSEQHVGSGHVDYLYGPDDGVWHPDQLVPHMGWRGSGCEVEEGQGLPDGFFDPWGLDAKYDRLVVHRFTEQLPGESSHAAQQGYEEAEEGSGGGGGGGTGGGGGGGGGGVSGLQWAMPVYGSARETAPTRGNLAIARQDLRPPWMSKPAFLAFGALRSYPLRQLHRLCAALHARALPLAQPTVHTLVRQLLYHIGPVSDPCRTSTPALFLFGGTGETASGSNGQRAPGAGAAPSLMWREGWDAEDDVLPTLWAELSALAGDLEHAPRDQEAVQLLGEVAAYLSDWHVPCRTVARHFAAMTSRVADEVEARVLAAAAAGEGGLVAQLRAKQVRWRAMALGCYGAGRLDEKDVGQVLQLLVLIQHGCVFQDDPDVREQLRCVQVAAHGVVVRRAGEVVAAAGRWPELLTAAVRRVLQRTPETLAWRQLVVPDQGTGRPVGQLGRLQHGLQQQQLLLLGGYEAHGSDGNLYSINVLDGAVLINGRPPSRLPKEVTEHPLFVRVFGQGTNFEVGRSGDGVLQTLSPVQGRFYDFFLADRDPAFGRGGQQQNRDEQQEHEQEGRRSRSWVVVVMRATRRSTRRSCSGWW